MRNLLALLLLVPVPSLAVLAAMWWWPDTVIGKTIFIAAKVWLVGFPLAWWLLVDRGKLSGSKPTKGGLGVGAVLGVVIAASIVGAYFAAKAMGWIDPQMVKDMAAANNLNNRLIYIGAAVYWITANSLMEEYVWRWFVFRKAEVVCGGAAAVAISALGFTAHHIFALLMQFDWRVTLLASAGVCIGGAVWSGCYLRYRSVWPGHVSHAIVDVPIFVIGYVLIFG
jgi:membrane protease YdiL (CAAX protease family)